MRQWLWDRMSKGEANHNVTAMHMVACASQSAAKRVCIICFSHCYPFCFFFHIDIYFRKKKEKECLCKK
jgi:hypothetical protein